MTCSYCRNRKTLFICLLASLLAYAGMAHAGELFPITDFYSTPESFATSGKPGDLIRSEEFDGYKLAPGVKATRILYGSLNSRGDLVAASGVVLIPAGVAPDDGWPVIAWAHGTSGVNRKCAPSLMAESFLDYQTPNSYTELGYAVVATDYAGLGTDHPLDYLDRISNGWDLINGVRAARAALPKLGENWLAIGHSAGAHTMRGVAELEADINDPSYLGVISVSGLGDSRAPMVVLSKRSAFVALFISEAVKARDPDFDHSEILTTKGLELLEVAKLNCAGPGIGRPPGLAPSGSEVLKENWDRNHYVDQYFKMDETRQEKYKGPVLVINGENEPPVVLTNDIEATRRMCQQDGLKVEFTLIADANHFTVLVASIKQQMAWITDRFAGREAPTNCENIPR